MAGRILYLEGASGISGDMTVAALLDLGADEAYVRNQLAALDLDEFSIEVHRVKKGGLNACKFDVLLKEADKQNHADHEHSHSYGHHGHRIYLDIQKLLKCSKLDKEVRQLSEKIFYILAKAEGKVHGVSMEEVHFHEVGAVDSIVDTVASAAAFISLKIDETVLGTLREGCGTVRCQHGEIPVPVPAVAQLAVNHGLGIRLTDIRGEMITPTGAAIAAALRSREALPEKCRISAIGYGAGTKDFAHPNVLRAMLLEQEENAEDLLVLETNVDDCSGEQLGFLQEQLWKLGVRDVILRPVYMKKNRPAYQLQVLCERAQQEAAEELIFAESTSIGIRYYPVDRCVLERKPEVLDTPYGSVRFKICTRKGRSFSYPEYEDIKAVCEREGLSYGRVYKDLTAKEEI